MVLPEIIKSLLGRFLSGGVKITMELRESESKTMNVCNRTVVAMTTNRDSRIARGESWLVRAATRIRRVIRETYIVDASKSKGSCQDFLHSDEANQAEATVFLKTGETVKVKASDAERFLLENHSKIEARKIERRGKPRGKTSGEANQ